MMYWNGFPNKILFKRKNGNKNSPFEHEEKYENKWIESVDVERELFLFVKWLWSLIGLYTKPIDLSTTMCVWVCVCVSLSNAAFYKVMRCTCAIVCYKNLLLSFDKSNYRIKTTASYTERSNFRILKISETNPFLTELKY